jgi:CxxC motif-containing protein (DUF1111 family)
MASRSTLRARKLHPRTVTLLAGILWASVSGCEAPATSSSLSTELPEPEGTHPHEPIAEGIQGLPGEPMPFADAEQLEAFYRGRALFVHRWTKEEGLGPDFIATSCVACHDRPAIGGASSNYRNNAYGGFDVGGGETMVYEEEADGALNGGVVRTYRNEGPLARGHFPIDRMTTFSSLNAVPLFGIGLLATLTEEELLERSDPTDADGDGISGRPFYSPIGMGRLSLKASAVGIREIITSSLSHYSQLTFEPLTPTDIARLPFGDAGDPRPDSHDLDAVPDGEVTSAQLADLITFSQLLAAPTFDLMTDEALEGRDLFDDVGCAACHTPRLDSPYGPLPLYADLLLHDMGAEGGDGILFPYGDVAATELKTQPLWGVAAAGPWMRDGRASTLEEAIAFHGGEATASRDAWLDLDEAGQAAIIAFLRSLGGGDTAPEYRQQPNVARPAPGDVGSYQAPPSGTGRSIPTPEAHEAGRIAFDTLYGPSHGLGAPGFSGDACSACHFEPTIGGSGPVDVNAIRQGRRTPEGDYLASPEGSFIPKHRIVDPTPFGPDPLSEILEHRQTPHLFGLGWIEAIPDAALFEHEDPFDADGDGVSGRVALLPDGRVGRLGWKANHADVLSFTCAAFGVEMGLSTPSDACPTYGIQQDDDAIADPEVSAPTVQDVLNFLRTLAPPTRARLDDETTHGEAVFTDIGCAQCHVPSLPSPAGPVPLFSDLLLHDVAPLGQLGIEEGDATMSEYRTPPLWGLSFSAPYWHTGLADTLDAATLMHSGEAARSRTAYETLSPSDRDALLAFLATL